MKFELIATSTFGLEAVVKRQIQRLGYEIKEVSDGKITYIGDERGIVRSNLWLRSCDRVLLKMAEFKAFEFEDLYQNVRGIPWEELIPINGNFTVTGSSVKSELHSVPACQSVAQKAIVDRLKETYGIEHFSQTGAAYPVKITILKNKVTVSVDTSGTGLNKRGYRVNPVAAPIKETMAAALIELTFWNKDRLLIDPTCGSGTIAIEAAMIARNIAPGLGRNFASEDWHIIDKDIWKQERKKAYSEIEDIPLKIKASDIDAKAIVAARENAVEAGVDDCIEFSHHDISKVNIDEKHGVVISNPPYGERIGDEEATAHIFKTMKRWHVKDPGLSIFVITADTSAEKRIWGGKANRRRKLYNGNIQVCYYQFHGEKE